MLGTISFENLYIFPLYNPMFTNVTPVRDFYSQVHHICYSDILFLRICNKVVTCHIGAIHLSTFYVIDSPAILRRRCSKGPKYLRNTDLEIESAVCTAVCMDVSE